MTTNKPMTGEQLDELLAVAVRMQRDAEVDCNFPSANFAYAVQVAVLELRRTREIAAALAAENAGLKDYLAPIGLKVEGTPATDAFLAEVRASAIPEGYVLVPVEPTAEMCDVKHVGVDVYTGIAADEYYSIGGEDAAKVWKAMLAAAPQQEVKP
ncbi:hypothetical protein LRB91_12670 [Leclercia adecarboxylata]|uniref:hypothetical protein n=1 Tax=Leclercia adecarboxylata TaxID=83655 RepID=UPI0022B77C49|nr:hypothetical protein [Leclercia adecarboxylata]MCZ7839666.1 hypothetical protein [Leclercia adecarboxylata]